ncbi:MAG: hypothetical protein ACI4XJ_11815, partial [Eubacteriales bacterium]
MKNFRKNILCGLLLLVLIVIFPSDTFGAEEETQMPSVIVNEDEWYKDTVSPMIMRDGEYYVPAEVFTMFGSISMKNASDDNLLITNSETGQYVSILFMSQAAAVNGEVFEGIGVFRDSGVYYIEAEDAADALGVAYEYYTSEEGEVTLRLYDENRIFSLEELVKIYSGNSDEGESVLLPSEENDDDEVMESDSKKIYVLCATPEYGDSYFPARDNLDYYGVDCTMLLWGDESDERILSSLVLGEYGLALPEYSSHENPEDTADEICMMLDSANEKIKKLTGRTARLTLTTGDDNLDPLLLERG